MVQVDRRRAGQPASAAYAGSWDNVKQNNEDGPFLPYPRRASRLLLAIAIPTGILFAVLATNDQVAPGLALMSWAGLNGLSFFLVRRQFKQLWRLNQAIRKLLTRNVSGRDGELPSLENTFQALGRELEQERARGETSLAAFRTALDSVNLPVITFLEDRQLTYLNSAAQYSFGNDLVGRDFAKALRNPEVLRAVDRAIERKTVQTAEFRVTRPVARRFVIRINPLQSSPGDRLAFAAVIEDVTDTERLQQIRSEFVADVSHELRTPLTAILGIVETLKGPARDDADAQDRFLTIMGEQAERMYHIVDDLLNLSRIELDEHQVPREDVDLGAVVRQVAEGLELEARDRGMTLVIDGDEILPVQGDREQLARVFQNLAHNAIKYGDPDTEVRFTGEVSGNRVRVKVQDQGQGIPREHLHRLTERFFRVDKARSRAAGGTGLGLAIVKHIVQRHRGELLIDSEVGRGSCFTVEIPLHKVDRASS